VVVSALGDDEAAGGGTTADGGGATALVVTPVAWPPDSRGFTKTT
jgi:hypothetical protein